MQITDIHTYNKPISQINFQKRKFRQPVAQKTLADIFETQPKFSLNKMTGIREGKFGTICDGSLPLTNFQELFYYNRNTAEERQVFKQGFSTNTDGFAYSFLKTKSMNPISTSYVHNCSAMYLYNKFEDTHFLYHIYPKIEKEHLAYIINSYMPEGFQTAAIVPGDKTWINEHKEYLPMVFETIKENNPKATMQVFHTSSKYPEIVGYKGKVYELPNKDYIRSKKYGNKFHDDGQASFKILNLEEGNINIRIHYCETIEELQNLKNEFFQNFKDKDIQKTLGKLINDRLNEIKKIQSFTDSNELMAYVKKQGEKYLINWEEYNHNNNYYSIAKDHLLKLLAKK